MLPPVPEGQISLPSKWTTVVQHKFLNPRRAAARARQGAACRRGARRHRRRDPLPGRGRGRIGCARPRRIAGGRRSGGGAARRRGDRARPLRHQPDRLVRRRKGDPDGVMAGAPHRLKRRFYHHRYAAVPMECRGVVAEYDRRTDSATIWSSTQVVHWVRREVAATLGIAEARVRCIALDVGGGFGGKGHAYPEDLLLPFLARRLGRPVRWIEDRREHFMSATIRATSCTTSRSASTRRPHPGDPRRLHRRLRRLEPDRLGGRLQHRGAPDGPYKVEHLAASGSDRRHQQGAERALSRRRATRGRRWSADRPDRAHPRAGAGRGPPAQHDPGRRDAVCAGMLTATASRSSMTAATIPRRLQRRSTRWRR